MSGKKLSAEQVWIRWKTFCEKDVGKARYTAVERLEQLDALCDDFRSNGVSFEEASDYKKKFVEFVVTREGMKGNGQYKGWKEKSAEQFDGVLLGYYSGEFETTSHTDMKDMKKQQLYDTSEYMARTNLIVAWTKYKYQDKWSEAICLEAHKIGSTLWNMFKKEVIFSNWAKSGERPNWAKNIF